MLVPAIDQKYFPPTQPPPVRQLLHVEVAPSLTTQATASSFLKGAHAEVKHKR